MAERRFVLVPLASIGPDRIIKGTGKTVRMLLRELPERAGEVRFVQHDW
jgi:7,8-dihydro-6-hydroxymethylpterin-pyrophosphokinase